MWEAQLLRARGVHGQHKDMLFVGCSMTDDNVHLIIDHVRKAMVGKNKRGFKMGTVLTLVENEMRERGADRTMAMCRNRHQRINAPKQEGKKGRNHCKLCGQIKRGHTCPGLHASSDAVVEKCSNEQASRREGGDP